MYKFKIEFISLEDAIAFDIKSESTQFIEGFVNELLSIFVTINEENKPVIESFQVLSNDTKNELEKFINNHNTKLPQLNAVIAFFNRLKIGDKFFFIPNMEMEIIENHNKTVDKPAE